MELDVDRVGSDLGLDADSDRDQTAVVLAPALRTGRWPAASAVASSRKKSSVTAWLEERAFRRRPRNSSCTRSNASPRSDGECCPRRRGASRDCRTRGLGQDPQSARRRGVTRFWSGLRPHPRTCRAGKPRAQRFGAASGQRLYRLLGSCQTAPSSHTQKAFRSVSPRASRASKETSLCRSSPIPSPRPRHVLRQVQTSRK